MMTELLPEEQEIEDNIELLKPVSPDKKHKVEGLIDRAKKNSSISLRISGYDLGKIKEMAASEGIPYQTLINSVLHKYVTHQLLEKKEAMKALVLMENMGKYGGKKD